MEMDDLRGKTHFATTYERGEVEQILKYAQWSILTVGKQSEPLRTYRKLLDIAPPIDLNLEPSQSFSRNIIVVEIQGAEIRGEGLNVTFMDLHGIIEVNNSVSIHHLPR
jgi:hypothetical protein